MSEELRQVEDTVEEQEVEQKTFTQEEVDEILKQRLSRERKQAEEKARKTQEAEKLKTMSEKEKSEKLLKDMMSELDALKRDKAKAAMMDSARERLKENHNITVPDKLLSSIISEDADTTASNIDDFAKLFQSAVKNAVNDRMKSEAPKTSTAKASGMTKAEIMAIKDPKVRIQKIKENMDLFR